MKTNVFAVHFINWSTVINKSLGVTNNIRSITLIHWSTVKHRLLLSMCRFCCKDGRYWNESQAIVTGIPYSNMILFKVSYGSMGLVTDTWTWKMPSKNCACGDSLPKFKLLPSCQFVLVFYVVKNYQVYTIIKLNARVNWNAVCFINLKAF